MQDIDEYQKRALTTNLGETPDYPFELLSEEVGEVSGKLAKYMRTHKVTKAEAIQHAKEGLTAEAANLHSHLIKELGDVGWAWVVACSELGLFPSSVLRENLEKLKDRQLRGVIDGQGDLR